MNFAARFMRLSCNFKSSQKFRCFYTGFRRSSKMPVETQDKMKTHTVAVEGNIGSGKTTMLKYFEKHYPCAFILPEPVNQWKNLEGHNLLDLRYGNPNRWVFALQSYVQLTMAQTHLQAMGSDQTVKLMERSIFSAKYCFVENHYQRFPPLGELSEPEYLVLTKWFDFLTKDYSVNLDLIVYLQTKPETVYNRIMKRGRAEEMKISMDYLKTLHNFHEDWLVHQKSFKVPCPVLVLDANCQLEDLDDLCNMNSERILFTDSNNRGSISVLS